MPEPDVNTLERAFKGLTIGVVKDLRDFDKIRRLDALQEVEEQFEIYVSGRAEEFAAWDEVDVDFATVFVDATGQRDSPWDRPHVTSGAVLETPDPVAIVATVMNWRVNDRNETVGAKVAIGVLGTDVTTEFSGFVHLTFQGYGTVSNQFLPDDLL